MSLIKIIIFQESLALLITDKWLCRVQFQLLIKYYQVFLVLSQKTDEFFDPFQIVLVAKLFEW
jgi:hypothetical protein